MTPFAGFKDWDSCMNTMREKYDEETSKKVCGKLKAKYEKDFDHDLIIEKYNKLKLEHPEFDERELLEEVFKGISKDFIEDSKLKYYCHICKSNHFFDSEKGKEHLSLTKERDESKKEIQERITKFATKISTKEIDELIDKIKPFQEKIKEKIKELKQKEVSNTIKLKWEWDRLPSRNSLDKWTFQKTSLMKQYEKETKKRAVSKILNEPLRGHKGYKGTDIGKVQLTKGYLEWKTINGEKFIKEKEKKKEEIKQIEKKLKTLHWQSDEYFHFTLRLKKIKEQFGLDFTEDYPVEGYVTKKGKVVKTHERGGIVKNKEILEKIRKQREIDKRHKKSSEKRQKEKIKIKVSKIVKREEYHAECSECGRKLKKALITDRGPLGYRCYLSLIGVPTRKQQLSVKDLPDQAFEGIAESVIEEVKKLTPKEIVELTLANPKFDKYDYGVRFKSDIHFRYWIKHYNSPQGKWFEDSLFPGQGMWRLGRKLNVPDAVMKKVNSSNVMNEYWREQTKIANENYLGTLKIKGSKSEDFSFPETMSKSVGEGKIVKAKKVGICDDCKKEKELYYQKICKECYDKRVKHYVEVYDLKEDFVQGFDNIGDIFQITGDMFDLMNLSEDAEAKPITQVKSNIPSGKTRLQQLWEHQKALERAKRLGKELGVETLVSPVQSITVPFSITNTETGKTMSGEVVENLENNTRQLMPVSSSNVRASGQFGSELLVQFHPSKLQAMRTYRYMFESAEQAGEANKALTTSGSPGRWVWQNLRGHVAGTPVSSSKLGPSLSPPGQGLPTIGGTSASLVPYQISNRSPVSRVKNFEEILREMKRSTPNPIADPMTGSRIEALMGTRKELREMKEPGWRSGTKGLPPIGDFVYVGNVVDLAEDYPVNEYTKKSGVKVKTHTRGEKLKELEEKMSLEQLKKLKTHYGMGVSGEIGRYEKKIKGENYIESPLEYTEKGRIKRHQIINGEEWRYSIRGKNYTHAKILQNQVVENSGKRDKKIYHHAVEQWTVDKSIIVKEIGGRGGYVVLIQLGHYVEKLEEDYKVKGHWRHLKSGKKTWVNEHERGEGKTQEKKKTKEIPLWRKIKNLRKRRAKLQKQSEEMVKKGQTGIELSAIINELTLLQQEFDKLTPWGRGRKGYEKQIENFEGTLKWAKLAKKHDKEEIEFELELEKKKGFKLNYTDSEWNLLLEQYQQWDKRIEGYKENLEFAKKALKKIEVFETELFEDKNSIKYTFDITLHNKLKIQKGLITKYPYLAEDKINTINNAFYDLPENFRNSCKQIRIFEKANDDPQRGGLSSCGGFYHPVEETITLGLKTRRDDVFGYSKGWLEEMTIHEAAHALDFTTLTDRERSDTFELFGINYERLNNRGEYAATNTLEFFAEGVAKIYTGNHHWFMGLKKGTKKYFQDIMKKYDFMLDFLTKDLNSWKNNGIKFSYQDGNNHIFGFYQIPKDISQDEAQKMVDEGKAQFENVDKYIEKEVLKKE